MEWRVCPRFPEYEVSEYGNLRRDGKVLARCPQNGYWYYNPCIDGGMYREAAARLVAEAFIGPKPFPDAEICHGDGNRQNDHWTNLRWDTRAENAKDRVRHGTQVYGERHGMARLTPEEVAEIKRLRANGVKQRDVAKLFNTSQSHVWRIVHGHNWNSETSRNVASMSA